jgi:hypothetical protein
VLAVRGAAPPAESVAPRHGQLPPALRAAVIASAS